MTALRAGSWLVFVAAAALVLYEPLGGDQYFFLYGARLLAEGSRLYLDFWDIKQPGIFWLNGFALQFANPELVVMLLDIAAWAITAALLARLVERDGGVASVGAWVPAVVGLLFLAARPGGAAGQVESFLGVLLALLLTLLAAPRVSGRRWFLFGVVSGLLMLLKLVWLLAPALMFATVFVTGPPRPRPMRLRARLGAGLRDRHAVGRTLAALVHGEHGGGTACRLPGARFERPLESRCPPMLQWLRSDYVPELVGAIGTWYVRAPSAAVVADEGKASCSAATVPATRVSSTSLPASRSGLTQS